MAIGKGGGDTTMSEYLFLFTIGPVQSFIAQARKTQDLYAGSFLLSHLIESTMKELKKKVHNYKFIFPGEEIKSSPNRFIAKVETDDIEDVGKRLKGSVKNEFEKIARNALNSLGLTHTNEFGESFWKQVKDHLRVNWVALPLDGGNYADTYGELESYLGAVKNVRSFRQLKELGRKCSLCGERNALFYRFADEERKNGGLGVRKRDGLLKKLYVAEENVVFFEPSQKADELKVQKGEGLCAICFTKRFADKYFKDKDGFIRDYPSTAEIALMDSLNKLKKLDGGLLEEYKKIFTDNADNFDAELFYKDNLTEKYFERDDHNKDLLEESREKLNEIYKKAEENGITLSRYYAILMLDGDSMGRWLSGEFLDDKGELLGFHKRLTEKLGSFAGEVENIIGSRGKLVYAGGDDVLAFINLNHLLPLMKNLRDRFPRFEKLARIKDDHRSSASAGVAIAHYKTPLSEVLKWARKMEEEAKSIDKRKDAFAIAVLKRSGETRKTIFKWKYDNLSVIEILKDLVTSLKQGDFSDTFIKNLGFEFRRLMDKDGKYRNLRVLRTEIKRLLTRSCNMKKEESETEEEFSERKEKKIRTLTEELYILYESRSLDNFLSSLDIADFIKREVNDDNKD